MKIRIVLACAVLCAVAVPALGQEQQGTSTRVEITYANPERFTDVRTAFGTDRGREGYLKELSDFLVRRATRRLGDGQRLHVTITDVDLAGDFEPLRLPAGSHVRIVREVQPPRIDLEFRLVGADGALVRWGRRMLRDLTFMSNAGLGRDDPLRFEKNLLDEWIRGEFQPIAMRPPSRWPSS